MRLHRLEIEGFGPFKDRQHVDFDAFSSDGIFLIGGRTGAGKSSVLDAVCFGLYGDIPRYDSGEKRLRSDHCAPGDLSEVVVEFSTSAGRFRVTRSPEYERPAKRGGGMTKQAPRVALDERVAGEWVGRAARAVDAGRKLDEILQLSQQQFLQVILLAQNRFARFLLSDSKERQSLLRRLFGTERFEDVQNRFEERRRQSAQALEARSAGVTAHLDSAEELAAAHGLVTEDTVAPVGPDERFAALERAVERAAYRVEQADLLQQNAVKSLDEADAAVQTTTAERDAQLERDRARRALAQLEATEPEINDAREQLARAHAAEGLRSLSAAERRSVAARDAERSVQDEIRARWDALVHEADTWQHGSDAAAQDDRLGPIPRLVGESKRDDAAELRDFAAELRRRSGTWEHGLQYERTLPKAIAEVERVAQLQRTAEVKLEAIENEREALPARIATAENDVDAVRREAERLPERETALERATVRHAAASDAELVRAQLAAASATEAEATLAFGEAVSRLGTLQLRRNAGLAGELASTLTAGEPCAVCGSTDHPKPAVHADPVTQDDIARAEQQREDARVAEQEAMEERARIAVQCAAAESTAEGRSVETALDELNTASTARDISVAAVASLEEGVALLQNLRDQFASLEARRDAALDALAEAQRTRESAQGEVDRALTEIDRARGAFESVQDRLDVALRATDAAEALAVSLEKSEVLEREVERATAEFAEALSGSPFGSAAEVDEALRDDAERKGLDARITAHKAELLKERAALLELELRALPEDPIDLAGVQDRAARARTTWQESVTALSEAKSVSERLRAHIDRAQQESASGVAEAQQHAVLENLANTLSGRGENAYRMNLETFVLAAELEEIVAAANLRLHEMSSGRYQLQHTDSRAARGAASGLGIVVFDAFTGQSRPAQSLSGGETFLSSLALALGLAEVVTARAGGVQLDTLFIDEGFGSLDADTLDVAMRTLDELRQGGRTVGVISHVEAMQEQIPAQLTVAATPDGPSVITM